MSPGCENCYAETFAHRLGFKVWGANGERREFGDSHWAEPLKWNAAAEKAGERHRVFCASMADVFEDHPVAERSRLRLWPLIDKTPWLDWLLLTKRPENMMRFAPLHWKERWPSNVWAGCTVEDQKRADERIPELLEVPAAVRFLSCEPLLGPIEIDSEVLTGEYAPEYAGGELAEVMGPSIDWVIVGGESGQGARLFDCAHARKIAWQCRDAGVPVFVKQLGRIAIDADAGTLAPLNLKDRSHGGDISEFPEDLRVRQFPVVR